MKNRNSVAFRILAVVALSLSVQACPIGSSSSSSSSPTSSTGGGTGSGGSGGTFTASDIIKGWSTGCIAGGPEPFSGAGYYIGTLYLNTGGNFNYTQTWYTGSNCSPLSQPMSYSVIGTYTVGGIVSGNMQSIQFTLYSGSGTSSVAAKNDTVRTAMNTACGTASPYCALVSGSCTLTNTTSSWYDSPSGNICTGVSFPSNSGSQALVNNVAIYNSSPKTLTMGAFYFGIPGAFGTQATPTSTSITLQ